MSSRVAFSPAYVAMTARRNGITKSFRPGGETPTQTGAVTITTNFPFNSGIGRYEAIGPATCHMVSVPDGNWDNGKANFKEKRDIHRKWNFYDRRTLDRCPVDDYPRDRLYLVDGIERVMRGPIMWDADGKTVVGSTGTGHVNETTWEPEGTSVSYLGVFGGTGYGYVSAHTYGVDIEWFDGEDYVDVDPDCEHRMAPADAPVVGVVPYRIHNPVIACADHIYCISTDGAHGDEPATAQVFSTMAAANAKAITDGGANRLFLWRRGQTHTWGRATAASNYTGVLSYGGADVTVDATFVFGYGQNLDIPFNGSSAQTALSGCHFIGPFDPENPVFDLPPKGLNFNGTGEKTFCNLRIEGFQTNLGTKANNMSKCHAHNIYIGPWQEYGFFENEGLSDSSNRGLWILQNPRIVHGNQGLGSRWNGEVYLVNQGPYRCALIMGPTSLDLFFMFTNGSWGASSFQPALRLGWATNLFDVRMPVFVSRIVSDFGAVVECAPGGNSDQNSGKFLGPQLPYDDMVYDKVEMTVANGASPGGTNWAQMSGITVRNYAQCNTDMPGLATQVSPAPSRDKFVHLSHAEWQRNTAWDPAVFNLGMSYYNWTSVNLLPPERQTLYDANKQSTWQFRPPMAELEPVTYANSLFVNAYGSEEYVETPNFMATRGPGNWWHIPDGGSVTLGIDLTPRWNLHFESYLLAPDWKLSVPPDTSYDCTGKSFRRFHPLPGSPFETAGDPTNGLMAVDDMDGNFRDWSIPTIGAYIVPPQP